MVQDIFEELGKLRGKLKEGGMKNKNRSYEKDREASSKEYQKMAACLDDTISFLSDRKNNADPIEVKNSMVKLYKASLEYYNSRVGVF